VSIAELQEDSILGNMKHHGDLFQCDATNQYDYKYITAANEEDWTRLEWEFEGLRDYCDDPDCCGIDEVWGLGVRCACEAQEIPTDAPTASPTQSPTTAPSPAPTAATDNPTAAPTAQEVAVEEEQEEEEEEEGEEVVTGANTGAPTVSPEGDPSGGGIGEFIIDSSAHKRCAGVGAAATFAGLAWLLYI
jgi:hypothetical protein